MARPLRIEYPGAYYHVINRGNNQEKILKKVELIISETKYLKFKM
jgi:hypothetical protein